MWCFCDTEVTCGGNRGAGKELDQFGVSLWEH